MEEEGGCEEGGRGGGEKQEREAADAEIEFRDKMFNAYKSEMEKYLSLFDDGGDTARKKAKAAKKRHADEKKGKRPVIPTVGAMKSKFETLLDADSPQVQKTSAAAAAAVGKLDPAKVLARTGEDSGQAKSGKGFVAPVVIDKDAFDRTMKQFEHYRDLCNSLNTTFYCGNKFVLVP